MGIVILLAVLCLSTGTAPVARAAAVDTISDVQDAVERILNGTDADAVERILDGTDADAVERILDGTDADAVERILYGADADAVERILDGADADAVERIINGEDATKGAHPHQVSLLYSGHHRCGGSVIADRVVLTAAHCVPGEININTIQVVVNDHKLNEVEGQEQTIRVSRKIVHKDYSITKLQAGLPNDIALLVLAEPVKDKSAIIPIATKQQGDFAGKQCTITGWGLGAKRYVCHHYTAQEKKVFGKDVKRMCTWQRRGLRIYTQGNNANFQGCGSCSCCKEVGRMKMTTLQEVKITALSQADCLKWWHNLDKHSRTVCVFNGNNAATGASACYGDSGGPLVCDGVLVGVLSTAVSGCTYYGEFWPSVYTRVNYFYDWVQTKLRSIESD